MLDYTSIVHSYQLFPDFKKAEQAALLRRDNTDNSELHKVLHIRKYPTPKRALSSYDIGKHRQLFWWPLLKKQKEVEEKRKKD